MDYRYTSPQYLPPTSSSYGGLASSTRYPDSSQQRFADSPRLDHSRYRTPEKIRSQLSQTMSPMMSAHYRDSPLAKKIDSLVEENSSLRYGLSENRPSVLDRKNIDNPSKNNDFDYTTTRGSVVLRETLNLPSDSRASIREKDYLRSSVSSANQSMQQNALTNSSHKLKQSNILMTPTQKEPRHQGSYSPSSLTGSVAGSAKKPPLPGKSSFDKKNNDILSSSNSADRLRVNNYTATPVRSSFCKNEQTDDIGRKGLEQLYRSVRFSDSNRYSEYSKPEEKPYETVDTGKSYSKSGNCSKRNSFEYDSGKQSYKGEPMSQAVVDLLAKYSKTADPPTFRPTEEYTFRSTNATEKNPRDSSATKNSYSTQSYEMMDSSKKSSVSVKYDSPHLHKATLEDFNRTNPIKSSYQSVSLRSSFSSASQAMSILTPKSSRNSSELSKSDFQIGKCLGDGKFGKVYPCKDKKSGTLYALKEIAKENIKKYMMEEQMLLQIKLQLYFDHPNIVKLFGYWADSLNIYLLMEYMEEGTLFSYLKKNTKNGGGIPEKLCAKWMKDICSAVYYMHDRDIVHRDIKPENIVLSHGTAKLCDFGWANRTISRRTTCCGTFDYASPEILEGKEYDQTVDLWALGVLTYELLTGKLPFYSISRSETMKNVLGVDKKHIEFPGHVSWKAKQFIQSLLKKDPDARTQADMLLKHPFLTEEEEKVL